MSSGRVDCQWPKLAPRPRCLRPNAHRPASSAVLARHPQPFPNTLPSHIKAESGPSVASPSPSGSCPFFLFFPRLPPPSSPLRPSYATAMLAFSLITVAFAAVASALPTAKRAILGPWCDNLGGGAFDNVSNFTVAAYNTTGTNTNTTGAPLVLGQAGAIDGASFKVFSVSRTLSQVPTTLGVSPVLPAAYMHMCVDVRDVSLQPVPLHCPRRRPSHPKWPRHVPDCHQRHHRGLRGHLRREQLGRPYPERADLVCRGEFNFPCLLSSAHPPRRLERDPLTLILPFLRDRRTPIPPATARATPSSP